MRTDVRIWVLMDNTELADVITRLCAAEGWNVLRGSQSVKQLPQDTDAVITDEPLWIDPQWRSRENSPIIVLVGDPHTFETNEPFVVMTPEEIQTQLVAALTRQINISRFQVQFFTQQNAEPITQLPHHSDLLESLERHRGCAAGIVVIRVDHAEHLYANLDPVSKTDLLGALGNHLQACLNEAGELGIFDAATFVITMVHCDEETISALCKAVQQRSHTALHFRGGQLHFSVSIGWSVTTALGNPSEMWRLAWQAMERAQNEGGDRICHSPLTDTLASRVPQALERDEFTLALQPQWHVANNQITGVEALLRWHGLEVGQLAPDHFIAVVERTHQMTRVGDWVLEQACKASIQWLEKSTDPLLLGVNISPQQFTHDAIKLQLEGLIKEQWINPNQLELELTHDNLLHVVDQHRSALFYLRDQGVRLAIDNLGRDLVDTNKLLRCPADTLKIDRSLVAALPHDSAAKQLVEQICLLGQRYNLRVIAVGVETPEQQESLIQLGCTDLQGYLLSPPMEVSEFSELLTRAK